MGYLLNEDSQSLVQLAREFCEKEVRPYCAEWDEKGIFPIETMKKGMELGFHMMELPEKYGGIGLDPVTTAAISEVFGYYDAGFATGISCSSLAMKPVLLFGTEEQKKKFADIVVPGGFASFALTESEAGSDAAACKTTAVKKGNEYVVNGTKCFITNGSYADIFVVFASTDKSKGAGGLSAFIIEKERKGVSVGAHENKMGIRSSNTSEIIFDEVHIPEENLIGKECEGFKIAMQTLDMARPLVGASAVGLSQRALDEAAAFAKTRICFGKPIANLEAIQFMLADMAIGTETARQMVAQAMRLREKGLPFGYEGAIAKCYAGDVAFKNAGEAVQILGGYGYSKDYPVEKLLRDSKIYQIYEGTNQIQRVVIAGNILRRTKA